MSFWLAYYIDLSYLEQLKAGRAGVGGETQGGGKWQRSTVALNVKIYILRSVKTVKDQSRTNEIGAEEKRRAVREEMVKVTAYATLKEG